MAITLRWKVKKTKANEAKGIPCFANCKVQRNG